MLTVQISREIEFLGEEIPYSKQSETGTFGKLHVNRTARVHATSGRVSARENGCRGEVIEDFALLLKSRDSIPE